MPDSDVLNVEGSHAKGVIRALWGKDHYWRIRCEEASTPDGV
jgi:hypothetical protein